MQDSPDNSSISSGPGINGIFSRDETTQAVPEFISLRARRLIGRRYRPVRLRRLRVVPIRIGSLRDRGPMEDRKPAGITIPIDLKTHGGTMRHRRIGQRAY